MRAFCLFLILAIPAKADDLRPMLICGGAEPFWNLNLHEDHAIFSTPEIEGTTFDIPHIAIAEGRTTPRAYSLIGERDTGIAIIAERSCDDTMSDIAYSHSIEYLTQDRGNAIMYTGCCRVPK